MGAICAIRVQVCEFPPYELINTLSSDIQQVFTRKAITHSDEYYQAFVDNMIKKIQIPVRPAAAATTAEPAARPQPLPTTTAGCLHAPTPQQVQPPPTHQQLHPDPHHPVAVATADSHSLHLPLQQQQNSAGGLAFGGTPPHMLHATATAAGAFPFVPYGYPAAAVHAVHAAAPMGTAMSHHHEVGALGRDITAEVRQLGREISLELQQLQQAQTAGAQLSARSLSQELLQHNSTVVALLQSQQQVCKQSRCVCAVWRMHGVPLGSHGLAVAALCAAASACWRVKERFAGPLMSPWKSYAPP